LKWKNKTIVFLGHDEMEIAYHSARSDMKLVGIIDENEMKKGQSGHKIIGPKELKN
jgi:hypothetical protein